MFKNVAAQQGVDMDAVYEEGSKNTLFNRLFLKHKKTKTMHWIYPAKTKSKHTIPEKWHSYAES